MTKNIRCYKVKYPLFLSDFNDMNLLDIFFRKTPHISDFMKLRPVGAQLFHADGRADGWTDMTKL
jgi:hypothetical protein